jgi:hypothetical protein
MAERFSGSSDSQPTADRSLANLNQGVLWRSWLAGVGLILCAVLARSRLRPLKKRLGWSRRARSALNKLNGRPAIDFYCTLESLLAHDGLARRAAQTPLEFAQTAGRRIAESTGEPEVAELAVQVVDAYYHVRFGEPSFESTRFAAVEEALQRIIRIISRQGSRAAMKAKKEGVVAERGDG